MRARTVAYLVLILAFALLLPVHGRAQVREAHVAGRFYPADSKELAALVGKLMDEAPEPKRSDKPRILISPHAGYPYSGPVAASAFRLLRGKTYDGVVVIGFTHQQTFAGSSVDTREAYETPMGRIPVDQEAVKQLKAASVGIGRLEWRGEKTR